MGPSVCGGVKPTVYNYGSCDAAGEQRFSVEGGEGGGPWLGDGWVGTESPWGRDFDLNAWVTCSPPQEAEVPASSQQGQPLMEAEKTGEGEGPE